MFNQTPEYSDWVLPNEYGSQPDSISDVEEIFEPVEQQCPVSCKNSSNFVKHKKRHAATDPINWMKCEVEECDFWIRKTVWIAQNIGNMKMHFEKYH